MYVFFSRHPDKNPDNTEEAKVEFQKIHAAYQRLSEQGDSDSDDEQIFTTEDFEEAMEFFIFMCATRPHSLLIHLLSSHPAQPFADTSLSSGDRNVLPS